MLAPAPSGSRHVIVPERARLNRIRENMGSCRPAMNRRAACFGWIIETAASASAICISNEINRATVMRLSTNTSPARRSENDTEFSGATSRRAASDPAAPRRHPLSRRIPVGRLGLGAVDDDELIGEDAVGGAPVAVRPLHAYFRTLRRAEADVNPARVAGSVATADLHSATLQ